MQLMPLQVFFRSRKSQAEPAAIEGLKCRIILVTHERVAQGSSLGAMVGTTGLAIYYPTDQLVPIINFTAQGSAYGSINSKRLDGLNT